MAVVVLGLARDVEGDLEVRPFLFGRVGRLLVDLGLVAAAIVLVIVLQVCGQRALR